MKIDKTDFDTTINLTPPIMKLLFWRLLGDCEKSQAIAMEAIEGLGETFRLQLAILVQGEALSPQQRQRLGTAIQLAEREDTPARTDYRRIAMRQVMLEDLSSGDEVVRIEASRALHRFCGDPVQLVIAEAVASRDAPGRCGALLAALAESRLEISESNWAILVELTQSLVELTPSLPRPDCAPAEESPSWPFLRCGG